MAVAFLFLGLFLAYQASQMPMRSLDGGPGAGVLPLGLGVLMVALSVWLVLRGWREPASFGNLRRVGIMVAGVAVYALALERVGFVVATSLLMAVLMVAFNDRHRVPLAALGVAGTALSYALFFGILKVQLPPDPWGLWR